MKIFDCLAAFIQDKMWGEDDIDDVLEKLKFEDAIKETTKKNFCKIKPRFNNR